MWKPFFATYQFGYRSLCSALLRSSVHSLSNDLPSTCKGFQPFPRVNDEVLQDGPYFRVCKWAPAVEQFKWKLLITTFTWCLLFSIILEKGIVVFWLRPLLRVRVNLNLFIISFLISTIQWTQWFLFGVFTQRKLDLQDLYIQITSSYSWSGIKMSIVKYETVNKYLNFLVRLYGISVVGLLLDQQEQGKLKLWR